MLKQAFGKLKSITGKSIVLGITGSTCTGKTTLANELKQKLVNEGISAQVIHQDVYYKEKEEVITLTNKQDSSILFYNYDQIDSLKYEEMLNAVLKAKDLNQVVIVEGNMVTNLEKILEEIDAIILLTIDKEICKERRSRRVYDPPDEKGYFEQVVWPAWEQTLNEAKIKLKTINKRLAFKCSNNLIALDEIVKMGTTRDTFDNKIVKQLEYEAYNDMAYSEMSKLCKEVRKKIPTIERICICHRLGQVPVGEMSVLIATSSPQRKAAIEATEWLINSLKEKVPIWKKEIYADGSSSWKENKEQPFNLF
uniref:Molybdopterin synthase catalytic subunit n=1 Tax=Meloidogyne hapla TaxID=6305 RepID=A0A1I8AZY0_MELHA